MHSGDNGMAVEKLGPLLRWPVLKTCPEAITWLEIQANLGLAPRTTPGALATSSAWLPRRGGEVPQQPGKGVLIHVMRLPAPKVANVPGMANQRWPARL